MHRGGAQREDHRRRTAREKRLELWIKRARTVVEDKAGDRDTGGPVALRRGEHPREKREREVRRVLPLEQRMRTERQSQFAAEVSHRLYPSARLRAGDSRQQRA